TALGGALPINPSGGVMASNPIGASGMLRFAEAAMQVRDQAGEHQVDGARRAMGHAYGGGSQFFALSIVGRDRPQRRATEPKEPSSVYIDLTPDERALRDELRAYFAELITPDLLTEVQGTDGGGPLYTKALRRMGADGWLGIGWPAEYGG